MSTNTEISLESLIGGHTLSGAYFDAAESGDVILRFTLDGQHYEAEEDSEDGYRSSLKSLRTTDVAPENLFPPVAVIGKMDENSNNVVLQFINANSGKAIIEIGTSEADDYYPGFVGYFSPENL